MSNYQNYSGIRWNEVSQPQGKISRYKPEKTVEKVQNDMNLIFFCPRNEVVSLTR